jgi:Xaa-Pro aminopeptidase
MSICGAGCRSDTLQVFFAYAILTPSDCTLFVNPSSLDEDVREHLHVNKVAVQDYSTIWLALETLGQHVKAQRQAKKEQMNVNIDAASTEVATLEQSSFLKEQDGKITKEPQERIEMTDKVLVGDRTSWAVVKVIGEVRATAVVHL